MRSHRRVTPRVAASLLAALTVFLHACDLDKVSGTPAPIDPVKLKQLFSISGDTLVTLGGTLQLNLVAGSGADISHMGKSWSSNNASAASIDANGLVSGVNIGTATITARLLGPELDTGYAQTKLLRVRYKGIKMTALDSITGLGISRGVTVNGTNNSNQIVNPALTTAALTAHDSGNTNTTIASIAGQTVVAKKNGQAYVVALFDGFRDSVAVKVRQIAKSITFAASPYVANAVCTGTCPNGQRTIPTTVKDVGDSLMVTPNLRWRSSDTTKIAIDSISGLMRVKTLAPTGVTITARADTVSKTQTVSVTQALASLTKFAGDAQTDTVGRVLAINPTVTALDSGGTAIAGATVTFRLGAGFNASVTDTVKLTDANGRATMGPWKVGDVAGAPNTVIATSGGASVTFAATTVAGQPRKLAYTVQPVSAQVASVLPSFKVAVQDSLSNVITTATDSVTIAFANNPTAATLGGTLKRAAVAGVATFDNVTVSTGGSGFTLQAAAGSLTSATSNGFDAFGAPNKLAFQVQPSTVTLGATMTPAVKVVIQDANGFTVANATNTVTLTISTNPGTATFNGLTSITATAVDGVATFNNVVLTGAGAAVNGYALTAAATGLTSAVSGSFNVTPVGTASKLAFSVQPTSGTAGTAIAPAIKVQVQDANGALVTTSSAQITLSIDASSPSGGTLSGAPTQSAVNGEATFTNVIISKSGTGFKLTAAATGLTSATSNSFNLAAGAANKLGFVQQPTHTVAGQTIAPAVTVEVQDANGNRVTTGNAVSVAMAVTTCTGATLSGGGAVNSSAGVATFSALSLNTTVNGCQLTATATGLLGATSTAFNSIAATSPAKLTFTTEPQVSTTAGLAMNGGTVAIQDANGANVTSTSSVSISIAVLSGPANINSGTTTIATTTTASFSSIVFNTAGTYRLVASATGFKTDTSAAFTVTPATASKVGFVSQPTNIPAGAQFNPTVTVAVQDQFGNTVTGANNLITLTASANSITIPFSTGSNSVAVNANNGVATFTSLAIKKAASGARLFASASSLTGNSSNLFDIITGPLAQLGFVVQPASSTTAGSVISPSVQVSAQDSVGNTISDFSNSITVALTGGTAGAVLTGTKTVAPTSGVSSFTNLSIDKSGTGYQLTASATGVGTGTSAAFAIVAGTATKLGWVVQPANTFLNAPLNPTSTAKIAIQDALGNTVTSFNTTIRLAVGAGPSATFRSNGSNVTLADFFTTNGEIALPTNVNMLTVGSGYQMSATTPFNSLTGATSTSFSVAANDVKSKLGWNNQPSGTNMYGVRLTTSGGLTPNVFVLDQWGNLVSNATDNITVALGTDGNPTTTLTGAGTVAAAGGGASFPDLVLNKTGVGYTLTATASGLTSASSSAFTVTAPGLVTTTSLGNNDMVRLGNTIYFLDGSSLRSVSTSGVGAQGTVATLTTATNGYSIATDGSDIYWAEAGSSPGSGTGAIKKWSASAVTPSVSTVVGGLYYVPNDPSTFQVDGTSIYFVSANTAVGGQAVRVVPKAGGVASDLQTTTCLNCYVSMYVAGGFIYYYDGNTGALRRMTTGGGSVTTIASSQVPRTYYLNGTTLIYSEGSNIKTLAGAPSAAGLVTPTQVVTGPSFVYNMVADGTSLFVNHSATLRKYSMSDFSFTTPSTSLLQDYYSLLVDSVDFYYRSGSGRIEKIAK